MKEFFDDISARLTEFAPSVQHKAVYNQQYDNIADNDPEAGYLFAMPAVFYDVDITNIKQMGAGYQMIEPLILNVHIVMQQLDAQDGSLDQNLDIFALKNEVFLALQKFRPYQSGELIRISEEPSYGHKNMYVYKQTYQTAYVDKVGKDVIRGIETTVPPADITTTFE